MKIMKNKNTFEFGTRTCHFCGKLIGKDHKRYAKLTNEYNMIYCAHLECWGVWVLENTDKVDKLEYDKYPWLKWGHSKTREY